MPDTADTSTCQALTGGGCLGTQHAVACPAADSASSSSQDSAGTEHLVGGGCAVAPGAPAVGLALVAAWALRRVWPAVALGLALAWAPRANAVDVEELRPPINGPFAGVGGGTFGEPWAIEGRLTAGYTANPAMLTDGKQFTPLLASLFPTRLAVGFQIARTLRLGVAMREDLDVHFAGQTLPVVPGDVDVDATIPLTDVGSKVDATWGVGVSIDRGGSAFLLGDSGTVTALVSVGVPEGPWRLGGDVRFRVQPVATILGLSWGNRLDLAFGVHRELGPYGVSVEAFAGFPVSGDNATIAAFPVEVVASVRRTLAPGVAVLVGGGAGVTRGLGSPTGRAFMTLELGGSVHDRDGDGHPDLVDLCPKHPEDTDGFEDWDGCPDPDNDHDGILDPADACPNRPETVNGYQDDDGCPDELSEVDVRVTAEDASDNLESVRVELTGGPATEALPGQPLHFERAPGAYALAVRAPGFRADARTLDLTKGGSYAVNVVLLPDWRGDVEVHVTDATGQPIAATATVGGATTPIPAQGGSVDAPFGTDLLEIRARGYGDRDVSVDVPHDGRVDVTVVLAALDVWEDDDKVALRHEVRFDLDSAVLAPESAASVDALAAWLNANPWVELVRIDGHADEVGGAAYNYALSLRRAEAVRDALVARGVEAARLQPIGSGEALLRDGDAKSRRVEFLVVVWDDAAHPHPSPPP